MKTKDKILEKARLLFNKKGIDQVSTREIAEEIGISIGNLCYHFAKKEDILASLAWKIHTGNNFFFNLEESHDFDLLAFRNHFNKLFRNQLKHKWLYSNFAGILLSVKEINKIYNSTAQFRERRMKLVLLRLADNGYLDDAMVRRDLETLTAQLNIIGRNWYSEARINFDTMPTLAKVDYYADLFVKILRPYFTAKGNENARPIFSHRRH